MNRWHVYRIVTGGDSALIESTVWRLMSFVQYCSGRKNNGRCLNLERIQ